MIDGQLFIKKFEEYCPKWLAESGDPIGLQIGTLNKPLQTIMTTLDIRPAVVKEAIDKKVDLLITKHSPMFRSIKNLCTNNWQNKMYEDLLKHDITVYTAHTNMDIIEDGLNDWFCEQLNIVKTHYLTPTHTVSYKKLAVYAPKESADALREALGNVGAGEQGNYTHTSYSMDGVGRFTPTINANPMVGKIGQEVSMTEEKIEVIFPELIQDQLIATMKAVHPYEEPAYDIFLIENLKKEYGLGRIGYLKKPVTLETFTQQVKHTFQLDGLRLITTNDQQLIKKVAICGGSGEKFYQDAIRNKADVYITGDVYYHTAQDMQDSGLSVIDPGHYIEQLCKSKLVDLFNHWKQQKHWSVTFIQSETSTNPFQFR